MGKVLKWGGCLLSCILLLFGYLHWDTIHEKIQLTVTHRSLSEAQHDVGFKHVWLYRNGYSTGGVEMTLSAELLQQKDGKELAQYFSQFIQVETIQQTTDAVGDAVGVADRVYNGKGQVLQGYQDIMNQDRLYLVAPGLLFVWPFVKRGHKVSVLSSNSPTGKPVVIESFTESPRTFHLHQFFTEAEADRLIERILEIDDEANKLQQSHVGHQSGKKLKSPHRTSENAFDQVSETAVMIRKRVFDVLSIGEYHSDMCDGLQLLRYQQKQAYIPHTDYFDTHTTSEWNWDPSHNGSNRFATVFMYLSNVTRGGQTVFPLAEMPEGVDHPEAPSAYQSVGSELFDAASWEMDMVTKCSTKLASYPRKAHAILFYSQKPNGALDPMSLHGGCPVLEGTKWGANLWVWNKRRYGLDQETSIKRKFSVIFQNPTERSMDLYWSGSKLATVEPHGKALYTTYRGHKWQIKEGERVVLEWEGIPEDGDTQTVWIPLDGEAQEEKKKKEEL